MDNMLDELMRKARKCGIHIVLFDQYPDKWTDQTLVNAKTKYVFQIDGGKGAKTAYTVGRLRVKPGTVRRLWTGYYFMMLVLYWAMAAAMLYGVMRYRVGLAAESMDIGPQSMVLAFYGSNLLHHMLPISDFFAWIGGIVGLLACAVGCMDVAQKEWTGQVGGPLMGIAVALTLGSFWVPMESSRILVGIVIGEMVVIWAALISWSGGDMCEEAVDDWRA